MTSPASSARSMRVRIGPYALWQLRDYIMDRGAPTLIISALLGYATIGPMLPMLTRSLAHLSPQAIASAGGMEGARAMQLRELTVMFLGSTLGGLVFLGALLAIQGLVANDRKQGYYRFLFTKPLSPVRYYGQAFLIHLAGFLGVMCVLGLIYGLLVFPVLTLPRLGVIAAMFLSYAGIAFMLSAVARWDWLSLVVVATAATYLWDRFGASSNPLARALYLLPPLHRTSEIYSAAAAGSALNLPLLGWFAGYGTVAFVVALVVLRYRRLAII